MDLKFDIITVGESWSAAVGQPESTRLFIEPCESANTIQCMFFLYKPNYVEINEFRRGRVSMRLFAMDDALFLLIKIGDTNWFDLPCEPRLDSSFTMANLADGDGYSFQIILADVPSGIVRCLRVLSISTEFSTFFKRSIDDLNAKREGFDVDEYYRKIERIRNRYSTSQMVSKSIAEFELKK